MDFKLDIKWSGLKEFINYLKRGNKNIDRIMIEELNFVGLQAQKYAQQLSPFDQGDLQASIHAEKAQKSGNEYFLYVGSNVYYAKWVHDGVGRGKRTRLKPRVKGYVPGPLYLRNAITLTEGVLNQAMERVIDRVLKG